MKDKILLWLNWFKKIINKVQKFFELLERKRDTPLCRCNTEVNEPDIRWLRQGIQHNFPHENLRRWGCYFFALLRWAQEVNKRVYTDYDIISLFDLAQLQMMPDPNNPGVQIPIITEKCFVNDPIRLLNFLAGKRVVSWVGLWTNDGNHPTPTERIFVVREKLPPQLAHFFLMINGERWDSVPYQIRPRAGFRVLV